MEANIEKIENKVQIERHHQQRFSIDPKFFFDFVELVAREELLDEVIFKRRYNMMKVEAGIMLKQTSFVIKNISMFAFKHPSD